MDGKILRVHSRTEMKWIVVFLVAAGCQRRPQVAAAYRADIERLCNVIAESGAEKLDGADRNYTIATWLAAHLETKEAHDYLIDIQPLTGEPKAAALEAEAARVGLSGGCALAAAWRVPAAP